MSTGATWPLEVSSSSPSSKATIVAMGALRPSPRLRQAEIKRMRVDPKYQRRGLGREILLALEQRAAELGFRTVALDTTRQQEAAIELYRAHGYKEVRTGFVRGLEIIFMEKSLEHCEQPL